MDESANLGQNCTQQENHMRQNQVLFELLLVQIIKFLFCPDTTDTRPWSETASLFMPYISTVTGTEKCIAQDLRL